MAVVHILQDLILFIILASNCYSFASLAKIKSSLSPTPFALVGAESSTFSLFEASDTSKFLTRFSSRLELNLASRTFSAISLFSFNGPHEFYLKPPKN